jgi:uncharacterized delta-60 repeat protein
LAVRQGIVPPRLRETVGAGAKRHSALVESLARNEIIHSDLQWEPIRHQFDVNTFFASRESASTSVSTQNPTSSTHVSGATDSARLAWLRYYASNRVASYDFARALTIDTKGNIYVTGQTDSSLSFIDIVTLKYSPGGTLRWKRRYTSDVGNEDIPYAIAVDPNGNVYVGGTSLSTASFYDFVIIKYDSNGVEQWTTRYDGPDSDVDLLTSMGVDLAGNVYVAGASFNLNSSYDFITIKYNTNGVRQWLHTFNGSGGLDDGVNALALDDSSNVYVTGFSNSGTSGDVLTIKYSTDGVLRWASTYDGASSDRDESYAITTDAAGNAYVAGYSYGAQYPDYLTIKYSPTGAQRWALTYDGSLHLDDFATAIAVNSIGEVYVGGKCTSSASDSYDFGTVKYDSNGVKLWDRSDDPGSYAAITALTLDPSENVIVTGDYKDFLTIKYSPTGSKLWQALYDGQGHGDEYATSVASDPSGNIVIAGRSQGVNTSADLTLVKYSSLGVQQWAQRDNGAGGSRDFMQSLKIDGHGNVFIAVTVESLPDTGRVYSMQLVKYSPEGDTIWTRRYDGAIVAYYSGMTLDSTGNAYMSGTRDCSGTTGACSIVTVKYSPEGTLLWSRTFESIGARYEVRSIAVDAAGNLIVGGSAHYADTQDFFSAKYSATGELLWTSEHTSSPASIFFVGPLVVDALGNATIVGYGTLGGMTTRWASNGTKSWMAICGGHPEAITIDDSGNTYVSGPDVTAKFDPSGALIWTNPTGGYSIAVDLSHNVYLAANNLLKYFPNGTSAWTRTPPDGQPIFAVRVDHCGDVFVGGVDPGVSVSKFSQSGTLQWNFQLNPFHFSSYRPWMELDASNQPYIGGFAYVGNANFYVSYVAKIEAVPALALSHDSISLGAVSVSCLVQDTLTLSSSTCTAPGGFSAATSDSDIVAIPIDPSAAPDYTQRYLIRFSPTSPGVHASTISFTHLASNVSTLAHVQGTGLAGLPQYSSSIIQFPTASIGCGEIQTLSIKNLRCIPLHVDALISDSRDFAVETPALDIAPSDSSICRVRFSPLAMGNRSAHLLVTHNQSALHDSILVQGTGTGTGTEVTVTDSFGLGWQLISLPVLPVCPSIFAPSYTFSHGYARHDTLEGGRGYWNKLSAASLSFAGEPVTVRNVAVEQGWNIIGSISDPVQIAGIQTNPSGIVQTPFFGFTPAGDYEIADTIVPGHAYWVKASQAGNLTLSQTSLSADSHRPMGPSTTAVSTVMERVNEINVADAVGHLRRLFFTREGLTGADLTVSEMPPPPPAGGFDARFSSGRLVEAIEPKPTHASEILMTGVSYPVHIRATLRESAVAAILEVGPSKYVMTGNTDVMISSPGGRVKLSLLLDEEVPIKFALSQNYPNPFNPSTMIRYELPVECRVLLTVYNTLGQQVRVLVDEVQGAGVKRVRLDAGNLTSGVYFYQLRAGGFSDCKKLLLIR